MAKSRAPSSAILQQNRFRYGCRHSNVDITEKYQKSNEAGILWCECLVARCVLAVTSAHESLEHENLDHDLMAGVPGVHDRHVVD